MKKTIFICTLLIICTVFTKQSKAQRTKKAKVMILGSYHMGNPGRDLMNRQADDVSTPKRQAEIEQLVKMIARFKPTKIAVEIDYHSKSDTINNKNYNNYIINQYKLRNSESDQIGFRLGKMFRHKKIYSINEPGNFNFGKVMGFAQKNGQGEFLNNKLALVKEHLNAPIKNISSYLKELNNPKTNQMSHDWHMDMLKIKKDKDYPGAEMITDLYERNLKIISNLMEITESPDDRILVIYGSTHASFFKSILFGSSTFEVIEAYDYL